MKIMVTADEHVNRIMGTGSSICEIIGDTAEKSLAIVLHKPIAVAAKRVGNKYEFDA